MTYQARLASYEAAKSHYTLTHPKATPEQYQAVMVKLAKKYGI